MGNSADPLASLSSSSRSLSPSLPLLPLELERKIFEVAAEDCDPLYEARHLILVARRVRVQEWIEPIMYRILLFINEAHYIRWQYPTLYEGHFRSERKAADFEKATRYARQVIIEGASASKTIEILQSCVNVDNLFLWPATCGNDEALLSIVKSLPVVKMTIDIQQFIKYPKAGLTPFLEFDHTICMNVTHLEALGLSEDISHWDLLKNLAQL